MINDTRLLWCAHCPDILWRSACPAIDLSGALYSEYSALHGYGDQLPWRSALYSDGVPCHFGARIWSVPALGRFLSSAAVLGQCGTWCVQRRGALALDIFSARPLWYSAVLALGQFLIDHHGTRR